MHEQYDPRGYLELVRLEREITQRQRRTRAPEGPRGPAVRTRAATTLRAFAARLDPVG